MLFGVRRALIDSMKTKDKNAAVGALLMLLAIIATGEIILRFWSWEYFVYQLPLLPILTRTALAIVFRDRKVIARRLSPEEKQLDEYRTIILGLMTISFAGLVALAIVDSKFSVVQLKSFYFMLVSFLGLYFALTIQSYKIFDWHERLGAALFDSATLSLFLALVAIFTSVEKLQPYRISGAAVILSAWLVDHSVRLFYEFKVAWTVLHPPNP